MHKWVFIAVTVHVAFIIETLDYQHCSLIVKIVDLIDMSYWYCYCSRNRTRFAANCCLSYQKYQSMIKTTVVVTIDWVIMILSDFDQLRLRANLLRWIADRRRLKVDRIIEFNNLTLMSAATKTDCSDKHCSDCSYCEKNSQHRDYSDKKNCFDNLTKNAIDCCYIDQIAQFANDL